MVNTMAEITYLLDFILVVETNDHQIIKQTPDDSSRYGNSTFYGDIKDLPLINASLMGKGHILTVNLLDGSVEVNGNKLYPPNNPPAGIKRKLIYYRTVQQSITTSGNVEKTGLRKLISWGDNRTVSTPKVKYFLGWQCQYRGKNCSWEAGLE